MTLLLLDEAPEQEGVDTNDFINFPLSDMGVTVTLNRVTKTTSNITGDRTLTYGSNETITVVFLRRSVIHKYDKPGLVEEGDAYAMARCTTAILRGDKITNDANVYRVEKVIRRKFGVTNMFDFCTLHLIT